MVDAHYPVYPFYLLHRDKIELQCSHCNGAMVKPFHLFAFDRRITFCILFTMLHAFDVHAHVSQFTYGMKMNVTMWNLKAKKEEERNSYCMVKCYMHQWAYCRVSNLSMDALIIRNVNPFTMQCNQFNFVAIFFFQIFGNAQYCRPA